MAKPTSRLIAEIIEFASQQPEVAEALHKRDGHPDAACTQIACRFVMNNVSNPQQSLYDVGFNYYTKDSDLEKIDDVVVRVLVDDSATSKMVDVWYR